MGGGIVWVFDDATAGAVSAGIGIAVAELMTFLIPSRGIQDAEDYRQNFRNAPKEPETTWMIVPQANSLVVVEGLALQVSF